MKDTLKKLAELENQRSSVIDQLTKEFNNALKQVFVDNPKLEKISMYVNNHEFNDGDATSFYLGWEDMTVTIDGEEISRDWNKGSNNPLVNNLAELFEQVQGIHENIYGDAYGELTIEREEILKG
jgi:hypothetical protein